LISAYGRFTDTADAWWEIPDGIEPRSLFIDVDHIGARVAPADLASIVRSVPPQITATVSDVMLRWWKTLDDPGAHEFAAAIRSSLERVGWAPAVRIIEYPVGQLPEQRLVAVNGDLDASEPADLALLAEARAGEVAALLTKNGAIWKPKAYHYRLPSGTHSDTFVRLSDAVRHPHDARALASWLLHRLQPGAGLVVDSASLVALTIAAEQLAEHRGVSLGRCAFLEQYPATTLDATKAVRDVDDGRAPVVALLSVHSTGALRDRFVLALDRTAPGRWTLDVVVDKAGGPATYPIMTPDVDTNLTDRIDRWHGLGASTERNENDCPSCASGVSGRLVHIDPRTFAGMVLPGPEFTTPSASWAAQQREFWELADRADAVLLDAESDVHAGHPRHGVDKRLAVKIDFDRLLERDQWEGFAERCQQQLSRLKQQGRLHPEGYDLILLDGRDAERENFDKYSERALDSARTGQILVVGDPQPDHWDTGLLEAVQSAERVLLFRLGLVTGLSMQRLLFGVQEARGEVQTAYTVDALVAHLRTGTLRERDTLANSIGGRHLRWLWESYLPWAQSPLQAELRALLAAPDGLDPHVELFLDERKKICSNFGADDQVLWGVGPHSGANPARISPMSYFGERLRSRAVYSAVGAAVQHARLQVERAVGAPLWRVFEMPAVVRSYYDPIILACILRWLEPRELWWGANDHEATLAVTILIERADELAVRKLLPELLLAGAQGKMPAVARPLLIEKAKIVSAVIDRADERAPLDLGTAMLEAGM
jgi:hypothetical protein